MAEPPKESFKQGCEIGCGNDLRGFVAVERKQPALVARHEVVGLAGFGQSQQKIVARIGRAFHARERADVLGELLDLVSPAARPYRV